MTKFETIIAALKRDAKCVVGLNTYNGLSGLGAFVQKYTFEQGEKGALHYAQTRIFEKGVKYVTRARFGN